MNRPLQRYVGRAFAVACAAAVCGIGCTQQRLCDFGNEIGLQELGHEFGLEVCEGNAVPTRIELARIYMAAPDRPFRVVRSVVGDVPIDSEQEDTAIAFRQAMAIVLCEVADAGAHGVLSPVPEIVYKVDDNGMPTEVPERLVVRGHAIRFW